MVSPSRSSITRKTEPSSATSSSRTETAPGWPTLLATYPSRRKRFRSSGVHAELGVEHLDRDAPPVVDVGRGVDDRHPADAEQGLEPPLVAEHQAHAGLGSHRGCVLGLDHFTLRSQGFRTGPLPSSFLQMGERAAASAGSVELPGVRRLPDRTFGAHRASRSVRRLAAGALVMRSIWVAPSFFAPRRSRSA